MHPNSAGFISARSSSVSLAPPREPYDVLDDDRSIARELLQVALPERPHLTRNPVSLQNFDRRQSRQPDIPCNSLQDGRGRRTIRTSNTWTSSDAELLSDRDEIDDRTVFIDEYNRLAKKHGVRVINEDWEQCNDDCNNLSPKTGWFRRILRRTSSSQSVKTRPERHLKHRRSISDLSLRLKLKRDKLKDKDLQELVRLCGISILYLPAEYAAGSLSVPTCFRATAQYLVQYGTSTRGIFRIPGSHNVVSALYNHYCSTDEYGQVIAGTVRCPTLPEHIKCDVHDVASAFKKFLSGLPGGILGSLQLLDAFISIQSQLAGQAELTRTKQSKVRARLIALAIATLRSQYRRELIFAVFGLLCMIGRTAETAHREDARGRPLPTSDLMGYGPLGIVFGPLLVGDLIEDYTMRLADPHRGLVLLPISPPKSRKERHKKPKSGEEGSAFNTHVDKIKVVNGITEMLITHWRDVIRHMRNLSALKTVASIKSLAIKGPRQQVLRPSASESFALHRPPDWTDFKAPLTRRERSESPTPTQRPLSIRKMQPAENNSDTLVVRKQRSGPRPMSSQRLSTARSMNILSPTLEESSKDEPCEPNGLTTNTKTLADRSTCDSDDCQPSNSVAPDEKFKEIVEAGNSSFLNSTSVSDSAHNHIIPSRTPSPRSPTPLHPSITNPPFSRPLPPRSTHLNRPPTPAVARSVAHREPTSRTEPNKNSPPLERLSNAQPLSVQHSEFLSGSLDDRDFEDYKTSQSAKEAKFSLNESRPVEKPTEGFEEFIKTQQHITKSDASHQATKEAMTAPRAAVSLPGSKEIKFSVTQDVSVNDLRHLRRIGASEPGLQPKSPSKSDRRISKSLYEDPKRKRNLIDWTKLPFQKDPLARVSQQDDAASLVSLAQAMNFTAGNLELLGNPSHSLVLSREELAEDNFPKIIVQDSPKYKTFLRKRQPGNNRNSVTPSATVSRRENRNSIVEVFQKDKYTDSAILGPYSSQNITGITSNLRVESKEISINGKGNIRHVVSKTQNLAQYTGTLDPRMTTLSQPKIGTGVDKIRDSPREAPSVSHGTPISQPTSSRIFHHSGSPSKISALVARFNTSSLPLLPANNSPVKTPVKSVPENYRDPPKTPGDSLIAPYTTNESSPTKSQKSSKSEKTPLSRRSPQPRQRTPKNGTLLEPGTSELPVSAKVSTPKRILRMSLHDPTPLRSTKRALEIGVSPSAELSTQSSIKTAPKFYENSFGSSQPSVSAGSAVLSRQQSQNSIKARSVSPRKTPPDVSVPSLVSTHFKAPKSFLSALENTRTASPKESLIDVPAFDGPGSVDASAEGVSSLSEKMCITQSMRSPYGPVLADFVHPDSPFREIFTTSHSNSPLGVSPTRRESLLFNQIRSLRRQLKDTAGQINYLQSQVEILTKNEGHNRADLEDARKETEMWKTRAEIAESELETVTSKIVSRGATRDSSDIFSGYLLPMTEVLTKGVQSDKVRSLSSRIETTDSSEKVTDSSNSSGRNEFGMSARWDSEESTGTVLRDVLGVIDGSDYSIWAKRAAEST